MAKRALVTGVTGQDGSYLTEFLLGKGYEVHGLLRRASLFNTDRIDHLYHDPHVGGTSLSLHYGDLTDGTALRRVIEKVEPDEVYNLGAQSHVKVSFEVPEYTADVVALGTLRLLEAFRDYAAHGGRTGALLPGGLVRDVRRGAPAAERDDALLSAQPLCREQGRGALVCGQLPRGLWALHLQRDPVQPRKPAPRRNLRHPQNHPRRRRIKEGLQEKLFLGNLDAKRDWGFAGDYVEAMWLMLQQDEPDDYVIATGESHSVAEMVEVAFAEVGLDWKKYVELDPRYLRPTEVDFLNGDATKARTRLNWRPRMGFKELIKAMVAHDLDLARQERTLKQAGFNTPSRGAASTGQS